MSRWRTLQFDFAAMASPCSILIDGEDEGAMRRDAAAAIAEVQRVETKYSRYQPGSVVSLINQAAGLHSVAVDDETVGLLDYADQLWRLSDGLFDITSGVLRKAWDFKAALLPDPDQLHRVLHCVGWQRVRRDGHTVALDVEGMELDFGGFGKEYASDRAAALLQREGHSHCLINLGGDLHALGPRGLPELQGQPWNIQIQHPRPTPQEPDRALGGLPLSRGGLATSGDYERFFERNGQRYCHILDPFTGWPVTHWQSVSVLAATTSAAGALATIAMLKGSDAPQWLDGQGIDYLAVRHDGHVTRQQEALARTAQAPTVQLPENCES